MCDPLGTSIFTGAAMSSWWRLKPASASAASRTAARSRRSRCAQRLMPSTNGANQSSRCCANAASETSGHGAPNTRLRNEMRAWSWRVPGVHGNWSTPFWRMPSKSARRTASASGRACPPSCSTIRPSLRRRTLFTHASRRSQNVSSTSSISSANSSSIDASSIGAARWIFASPPRSSRSQRTR